MTKTKTKAAKAAKVSSSEAQDVADRGVAPASEIPEGSERNPLDVLLDKNSTAAEKAEVQDRGVAAAAHSNEGAPAEIPEGSEANPHDLALAGASQK